VDTGGFIPVAKVKDVKPGQIKTVRARGGYEVAIANAGGRFYAFAAYCPHQGWPLKWGAVEAGTLVCGLHGWSFDLTTGDAVDPPLADCLETYPVRVAGDVIEVGLLAR
jgi:nitrite reductase/ring-hydroxylating ferredoxin subunit